MPKCTECNGHGEIFCPVCKGTKKDPRNNATECTYCEGKGHKPCNFCDGTGEVPEWFDNL